ncbi:MAG: hypothetical protein C4528_01230 [Gammaproteobacteria bacterium]|nr:MAG: hypothetical protein C4528_01230 [Gammaproteobacteria bacterium]
MAGAMKNVLLKLFHKPAHSEGVAGIALAPGGVSLARIVRTEGGRPRVTLCVHHALPDERGESFAALVRQHGLADARCVELLEVNSYQLLLVEAPNVTPAELKAAVRWRIKDLINFHIDDAVIDVFDIPAQNLSGQSRMMYVVVTRAALVQEHIALVKNAGLDLAVIDIPEMALRNITALFPEDSAGVVLVHLTPQGGHIILTRAGTLYLARKIELNFARLFSGLEAARPDEALPDDVQRLLDNIVLEVQRSLDYCESHYSQPSITHLLFAPLERELPGAVNHVANSLGLKVRQIDLNEVLQCEAPLSRTLQAQCLLAVGAALRDAASLQ